MSRRGAVSDVVRLVRGISGSVAMRTELIVRFDYGSAVPWVTQRDDGRLQIISGPDRLLLDTSVPLHGQDMRTVGEFEVAAGQEVGFVLTWTPSYKADPEPVSATKALKQVESFWVDWAATYQAGRREVVRCGAAFAADAKGAVSLGDRRNCRRRHDVAPRAARRLAQLGLPLLLAARRHLYVVRTDGGRFPRGSKGLAQLAAARRRGQSRSAADHVRRRRRAASRRISSALADGLRRRGAGAHRQCRSRAGPA